MISHKLQSEEKNISPYNLLFIIGNALTLMLPAAYFMLLFWNAKHLSPNVIYDPKTYLPISVETHPPTAKWKVYLNICLIIMILFHWLIMVWWNERRKNRIMSFITTMLIFGYPCSICWFFFFLRLDNPPWRERGRWQAQDGSQYVDLNEWHTTALGLLEYESKRTAKWKILGITNGDWPRTWIPLVRNVKQAADSSNLIASSNGGMLFNLSGYPNCCYYAYDLQNGIFYGNGGEESRGNSIMSISSFASIGPNDKLYSPDVNIIIQNITQAPEGSDFEIQPQGSPLGVPSPSLLRQDLNNPSPAVREAAQIMLDAIEQKSAGSHQKIRQTLDPKP
ncbi:hypothetical protein JXA32_10680 [Candidatus Sumerlaeota bacterium]|nr:hypothetical protein [Candidatus Sumerlaeota bacterium]